MRVLSRLEVRNLSIPKLDITPEEKEKFKPLLSPFEERRKHRSESDRKAILSSGNHANSFDINITTSSEGIIIPPSSFIVVKSIESINCTKDIKGIFTNRPRIGIMGAYADSIDIPYNYVGQLNIKVYNIKSSPIVLLGFYKVGKILFTTNADAE